MRLAVIRVVVACLISFGLDLGLDHIFHPNDVLNPITRLAVFYHWLVTSGPRKPELNFTILVELSDRTTRNGVSLLTVCRERALTAALLETLEKAYPSVVVLDKWYGEDTCKVADPHDQRKLIYDQDTRRLINAIKKLCKVRAIVVVGRGITEGSSRRPFQLDKAINFGNEGCSCVRESVVNISLDLRRLKLWRPEVEPVADSPGRPPPSIALAAGIANKPRLQNASGVEPFVSFLRSDQFDGAILPVKNLVCSDEPWRACKEDEQPADAICGESGSWRACKHDEKPLSVRSIQNGRVVVFGEQMEGYDQFDTVVGREAGFILQANYIESLLDNRLFSPVPEILNIFAGILMLVGFELILTFFDLTPVLAFALAGLFIVAVFLLGYLVVNLAGFYPDPRFSIFSILGSRVISLIQPRPPLGPIAAGGPG